MKQTLREEIYKIQREGIGFEITVVQETDKLVALFKKYALEMVGDIINNLDQEIIIARFVPSTPPTKEEEK